MNDIRNYIVFSSIYSTTYSDDLDLGDAMELDLWSDMARERATTNRTYNPKGESVHYEPPCRHPKKYLNKITTALQFWVCPDCKIDLGDK